MKKYGYLFFFILLGLLGGIYLYQKYRIAPSINFETLALKDLKGNTVRIADFKGHKAIVSFGASWCGSCWKELRTIEKVKDQQLGDVEVIVISDENPEKIAVMRQNMHPSFIFLKLEEPFSKIGINTLPTTYLLNKQLTLRGEHIGYLNWSDPSTLERNKKLLEE